MSSEENSNEKRSITLLELSRKRKKSTPPPESEELSESDYDQPPVATVRKPSLCETTSRRCSESTELKLLTSRRSSRSSPKISNRPRIKSISAASASHRGKDSGRLLRSRSITSTRSNQHMTNDRSNSISVLSNADTTVSILHPRNHYIKAVRRGIPDIVTTDTKGQTRKIVGAKLRITPYFVCYKSSKTKRNLIAWIFSLFTILVCVVCPVVSFVIDISFLAITKQNYYELDSLLKQKENVYGVPTIVPIKKLVILDNAYEDEHFHRSRHGRHRYGREVHDDYVLEGNKTYSKINGRINGNSKIVKEQIKDSSIDPKLDKTSNATTPDSKDYSTLTNNGMITRCQKPPISNICATQSELIEYVRSSGARKQLDSFKHVITNVYEPIFIIGSFASFILCIFTRSVVMVTQHSHFLSAYVMNMVVMPLSLASGALSFKTAWYYVGPNGFECWKCAWLLNCTDTTSSVWMDTKVIYGLKSVVTSKLVDGMAGGCVLSMVLLRLIWIDNSHVTYWWNLIRGLISLISISFCIIISTAMIILPSVAVFQFTLLEKLPDFERRDYFCYFSMSMVILGITAWATSLFVVFVYLSYRLFVYCRVREFTSKNVVL